ncbi:hypothetical protein PIB30_025915 [Stylosanthes scabra]|uniref:Uncharacterized protein n=1 Tax=Stylosanthes scabra TaxID=79078 RepID=A0ABU6Z6W4_9FABA|nr:hypothetical protein [Stylosanthes scabra]
MKWHIYTAPNTTPLLSLQLSIILSIWKLPNSLHQNQKPSSSMAGSHLLTLLNSTSRSSLVKPNTTRPFFNNSTKNYGTATSSANRGGRMMEERAPSTAEEFQRVAEEKSKNKNHEGAARNGDDGGGAEHATNGGDSKVDSSKKRYKEH